MVRIKSHDDKLIHQCLVLKDKVILDYLARCLFAGVLVITVGCPSPNRIPRPVYGVEEVDEAVKKIVPGVTTSREVESLLAPHIEIRALYRVKATGNDREYYAVPMDRQIWLDLKPGTGIIVRWELEPKSTWYGGYEGGYITLSPDEQPF